MHRNRVKSAGVMRGLVHNGDISQLQATVCQLQQQLLITQAENKKAKDQLGCLISLVKRAWTGDKSAVLHVANIVGVAPPDVKQESLDENHVIVSAVTKTSVLNNWAKLTIGLLNREYCHLERDVEDSQRKHLLQRNAFLEGQLEKEYTRPAEPDRWEVLQHPIITQPPPPPPPPHIQGRETQERVSSAKKKPTIRHLYRPANQKPDMNHDLNYADQHTGPQDSLLYRMSNGNSQTGSHDHYSRSYVNYADPRRYSSSGLFDEENALGSDSMQQRKRPPSGKDQKYSDTLRSRPKSSVLPKGERPLKYETTRPVSASQASRAGGQKGRTRTSSTGDVHSAGKRPPSGKQRARGRAFITSEHDVEEDPVNSDSVLRIPVGDVNGNEDNNGLHFSDTDSWDSEAEERERRQRAVEAILVKIKRPESIDKFEKDVTRMGHMEDDFKERTLALQKKLGISPGGLVL